MAVQADWMEKDLYAVLGVAENADDKTISRAYRKLARELHPDTHPDDPDAAERFKEVTAAYDVLGDAAKRGEYDEFRRAVNGARSGGRARAGRGRPEDDAAFTWQRFEGGGFDADLGGGAGFDASTWTTFGGEGLDDLLEELRGRSGARARAPARGVDLEAVLELDFEDALRGLTTQVSLDGPGGRQSFSVRVPAGVDDGQRLRLAGKGGPGRNGGPDGDLYVVVQVAPHPVFARRGRDLVVRAPISWPQAVLGAEIEVPTPEGPSLRVRVPAGTPEGRILRVRGHGVRTAKGTGDLLVEVHLSVPDHLTDEQRRAVEAVAKSFDGS
ncbi:MAG: DnaJ domain-containing protein [Acidimicrobiales bacterium]|nr:DnaJ domain-containing protein [Acidimicrobiales bacterium]MBO0886522.1 DnaJ domain-containing protein [Acidimicrobiales bacterium]MBO0892939.1 DnaJ domain-containing protein [Acidimicrobiales bacterium]